MITGGFHVLIVLMAVIAAALLLVGRFTLAARISPILLILCLAALAANLGLIPTRHPLYASLSDYAVPFAVCQILLHVNLATIRRTGSAMLKAFGLAGAGSLLGCLAAGVILRGPLDGLLEGQGWKLAGPYIGTYIGGSLNFFSMWKGLGIENPELFAAANAIDNLALVPIFGFWVVAANWLERFYPSREVKSPAEAAPEHKPAELLNLTQLVVLIVIALAIMAGSELIKEQLIDRVCPAVPGILVVTTLALVAGQSRFVRELHGAKVLADFAFYLFFAAVGAMIDIPKAVGLAPILFLYVSIILVTQISFVLVVGRLMGVDFRMLAVASIAAKAGPSTVVAYTNARGWNELALPGVAAALLGYVVGNYVAFAGAQVLRVLVG